MNILQKIKMDTGNFTKTELKIAQYVLKNHRTIISQNIKQATEIMEISTTSIVRFSKRYSDNGFRGLKLLIAQVQVSEEDEGPLSLKDEYKTIQQKLANTFNEVQLHVNTVVTEKDMQGIMSILKSNELLFIAGDTNNNYYAATLCNKLNSLGRKATNINDWSVIRQAIRVDSQNSCLMLFADEYTEQLKQVIQDCNKTNHQVIILTEARDIEQNENVISYGQFNSSMYSVNVQAIAKTYLVELIYWNYVVSTFGKQRAKFDAINTILNEFE